MNQKHDALALAAAGSHADPHSWLVPAMGTAPVLAECAVVIVAVLCITVVVLVRSTEPTQRLEAIKALVPILLALASRLTSCLSTWRKS